MNDKDLPKVNGSSSAIETEMKWVKSWSQHQINEEHPHLKQ